MSSCFGAVSAASLCGLVLWCYRLQARFFAFTAEGLCRDVPVVQFLQIIFWAAVSAVANRSEPTVALVALGQSLKMNCEYWYLMK